MAEEFASDPAQPSTPAGADEGGAFLSSPGLMRPLSRLAALGVLLALLLYYPVGAWRADVIDDDLAFTAAAQPAQSRALAVAAALLHREVDQHGWIPSQPFFMPSALLSAMPNYQLGMAAAIARFTTAFHDHAAAFGGADADLTRAVALIHYPPDLWMIDPAAPWGTVPSSDKQFRNAAWELEAYNRSLATGATRYGRGPETLRALVRSIAWELDSAAALLDEGGQGHPARAFWQAKGRAYADYLLLVSLGRDYDALLRQRGLEGRWRDMTASLAAAARLHPLLVLSGSEDGLLLPNHPAALGFHLLRAESRLGDLAGALS